MKIRVRIRGLLCRFREMPRTDIPLVCLTLVSTFLTSAKVDEVTKLVPLTKRWDDNLKGMNKEEFNWMGDEQRRV